MRDGRGVVRLVEAAVGEGDAEIERRRAPATTGRDPVDALDRRRRTGGDPQTAVGGEALLGGEVVHVDLRRVPGQTTGARRGVDGNDGVAGAGRPDEVHRHAGGGLVVGEGEEVDRVVGDRLGMIARVAGDEEGLLEMRRGRAGVGELGRELAEHEVLAAPLDQAERGDVPEHRRAPVAEHDLPARRQAEQVGQPGPDRADEPLHGLLAVGRPEDGPAGGEQVVELLGAHLRRAGAEASVGWAGARVGAATARGCRRSL